MRVVAFLYAYPPDRLAGADLMSQALLEALAAAGHDVAVHPTSPTAPREQNGVRVAPHPYPRSQEPADLIYTHPDLSSAPYRAAAQARVPLVGVVHNTSRKMAQALAVRRSTLTVWNSTSTREQLHGRDGIVCRPPLDIGRHWWPARPSTRTGTITLVNLSAEKGGQLFWDLAARLPHRRFLGVVGAHGVQITRHPKLGTLPNVDIVGPVHPQRMPQLVWRQTRVLIAPSSAESWGMAATEALCSGIPVIAHPTAGLVESLGDVGRFADRDQPDLWPALIDEAWDADPHPLTARAYQLAEQSRTDLSRFVTTVEALCPPT